MTNLNNVWKQSGDQFWPGTTATNVKALTPGIYRYVQTMQGWYLERTANRYTFPYKVYGTNDAIIDRVKTAWKKLDSNFGILLNGLKGTGKTITAQQIVNWAIDEGLIVLNVQGPIPLAEIMERIEQPMLVLFDEFEKTHDENREPGCQQHLLSAIDGLSRNEHKKIFLFTTNMKKMNDNFIDRPSRIRYSWEFDRVSEDIIEMLMADMLDPELVAYKQDIMMYLNSRAVLTIDVVKTIITECNTFKETPEQFKSFMNISEKGATSFRVEIIDDMGNASDLSVYFRTPSSARLQHLLTKSGKNEFLRNFESHNGSERFRGSMGQEIELLYPLDQQGEWIAHVQVLTTTHKSWIGQKLSLKAASYLWLDEKPANWEIPAWSKKMEAGEKLTDEEENDYYDWESSYSVHGNYENRKKVKIKITADNSPNVDYRMLLV